MKIPKYIENLLENSKFRYLYTDNKNYAIGYTFEICKPSDYMHVNTFNNLVEKIVKWSNSKCPNSAYIICLPRITHYGRQTAIITIYDPVMKYIEHLIKE